METKEFVEKFISILTKVRDICGYDCLKYYVISDDPYCDVDYGADENGFLIIESEKSNLKVSDLQQIRYRVGPYLESNLDKEYYISFIFKNNIKLYFYLTNFGILKGIDIGDKKFRSDSNAVVEGIIFTREYNWKDDFVIKGKEVVAYIGHEEEVRIPEGVESIGVEAFEKSRIGSIVFLPSIKTIKRRAFWFSSIKHVELCSVGTIEEEAFARCWKLEELSIPESVKEIQKDAFSNSGLILENIENHSKLNIDDNMLNNN